MVFIRSENLLVESQFACFFSFKNNFKKPTKVVLIKVENGEIVTESSLKFCFISLIYAIKPNIENKFNSCYIFFPNCLEVVSFCLCSVCWLQKNHYAKETRKSSYGF